MKNSVKYLLLGIVIIGVIVFMSTTSSKKNPVSSQPLYKSGTVVINNHELTVEIADTEATRTQGLSSRDSLGQSNGMLFVFASSDKYTFWMKDMKFPLDFIWISNHKVIGITPEVLAKTGVPDADLPIYSPTELVDKVLEVNSGWAAKNQIKVGDEVFISQPTNK